MGKSRLIKGQSEEEGSENLWGGLNEEVRTEFKGNPSYYVNGRLNLEETLLGHPDRRVQIYLHRFAVIYRLR